MQQRIDSEREQKMYDFWEDQSIELQAQLLDFKHFWYAQGQQDDFHTAKGEFMGKFWEEAHNKCDEIFGDDGTNPFKEYDND